jgi:hypothetical protein
LSNLSLSNDNVVVAESGMLVAVLLYARAPSRPAAVPENPVNPLVPLGPENPEYPEYPENVPENPDVPDAPDIPDGPENPENVPENPDLPENPDTPENPDLPENPDVPENPEIAPEPSSTTMYEFFRRLTLSAPLPPVESNAHCRENVPSVDVSMIPLKIVVDMGEPASSAVACVAVVVKSANEPPVSYVKKVFPVPVGAELCAPMVNEEVVPVYPQRILKILSVELNPPFAPRW